MTKYIFILLILLCSCSAEKRLERILRNNPQLKRTTSAPDTTFKDITIKAKKAEFSTRLEGDTSKIDSSLSKIKGKVSDTAYQEIKNIFKEVIKDVPVKKQNRKFKKNGISGNIIVGDSGKVDVIIDTDSSKLRVPVSVTQTTEINTNSNSIYNWKSFFVLIALLILLIWGIYKK